MTQKEIEIAPMLDWTDSFFRQFFRLISRHAPLYTEMIAEQALVHGNVDRLLNYAPCEQPIILQVGGSTPLFMSNAAKLAEKRKFKAININAGCPSERVQAGAFGACLMAEPQKVADCVRAMKQKTALPITIKTRIALDTHDDKTDGFDACCRFIETTAKAGCRRYIIHARKARLKGLTPKENRQKIALNYPLVYRIKETFPNLEILINGNILSLDEIKTHMEIMDGVMIGRWAYADPYGLSRIDELFYDDLHPILSRSEIVTTILPLLMDKEKPLHFARHMMGLYAKTPVSKVWKKALMENNVHSIEEFLSLNPDY